jgi:antitoxin component YwqK of YwqJK toxin-antitoxin module
MKKASLIILLFTLSKLSAQQPLDIVKTYYDPYTKIKLKEVYTVLKNTPTLQGLYKLYSEGGELLVETNYANGKMNGSSKTFFNAEGAEAYGYPKEWIGKVEELQNYKNDVLDGQTIKKKYSNDKLQHTKIITTYFKIQCHKRTSARRIFRVV